VDFCNDLKLGMRNFHGTTLDSKVACYKTVLILKKCIWNDFDLKGKIYTELHKQIFTNQANDVPLMIGLVEMAMKILMILCSSPRSKI
jgi:hypothetical protein